MLLLVLIDLASQGQSFHEMEQITAYISVLDGKFNIISSLQSFQITLKLAVVKEDFLHHISPFNEPKRFLKKHQVYTRTTETCMKTTKKSSKQLAFFRILPYFLLIRFIA